MNLRWHSDKIFFETLREAEEWAGSISNEIHARNYDGYITPDYKVAYVLAYRLASVKKFNVHTETGLSKEDTEVFRVWVVPAEPDIKLP
ncbi:hypothetical protein [Paenibacillus medicaginis]|uniref:Uncharacterized protein n=1 Tax=Paenibacillus medicaginis TaxID=1470560 RepID=A0ABV5C5G1_9BACL